MFHGDTLFAESEILDERESESRDHVAIVTAEIRAFNQEDDLVLSLERTFIVLKRSEVEPVAARPTGWPDEVGTQPEELE